VTMSYDTIEHARHRWREILPLLGVETRFLLNKHGPCPLCGGKDRYRFDDRDGTGSYYCNQCGPGAGIVLLRKLHRWDFATACNEVNKIIRAATPAKRESRAPQSSAQNRRQFKSFSMKRTSLMSSPPIPRGEDCPLRRQYCAATRDARITTMSAA
jgi:putative DNA primase/helicase